MSLTQSKRVELQKDPLPKVNINIIIDRDYSNGVYTHFKNVAPQTLIQKVYKLTF